jgi:hypothetical protein
MMIGSNECDACTTICTRGSKVTAASLALITVPLWTEKHIFHSQQLKGQWYGIAIVD